MAGTKRIDDKIDLMRAIEALPPRQYRAMWLWAEGWRQQEIAHKLGVNQATVSRMLASARVVIAKKARA